MSKEVTVEELLAKAEQPSKDAMRLERSKRILKKYMR